MIMSEAFWVAFGKSQFETILKMPSAWIMKGDNLLHAAEALFKISWRAKLKVDNDIADRGTHSLSKREMLIMSDYNLYMESGFLFGLSIENYLKAIWLQKNSDNIKSIDKIPQEITIHDLCLLCSKTDVVLTKNEKKLFGLLSDCIIWYGRYPVPISRDSNATFWKRQSTLLNAMFSEYPSKCKLPSLLVSAIEKIRIRINSYRT